MSGIAAILVAIAVDALRVIDRPLVAVVVGFRSRVDAQTFHVLDAVDWKKEKNQIETIDLKPII